MRVIRTVEDAILYEILRANVDVKAVEFSNLIPYRIERMIRYKLRVKVIYDTVKKIIEEYDVPLHKRVGYYNLGKAVDKIYRLFGGKAFEKRLEKKRQTLKIVFDLDDHIMDVVVERVLKAMREYDADRDKREIEVKQYIIGRLEELKKIRELTPKGLIRVSYKEYLGEEGGGKEDRDNSSGDIVGEA